MDLSKMKDPPAACECPYCLTYKDFDVELGMKLLFLKGNDAGYRGVVTGLVPDKYPAQDFFVRMEYEKKSNVWQITSPKYDRYLLERDFQVPSWMPSLSIDDNASLHDALLRNICGLFLANDRSSLADNLHGLIGCCWWNRFPLCGADIWPLLAAHGVRSSFERDTIELFDFGVRLLRSVQGRSAIKRKSMPPMSQGRYLTKRGRELNIQLFGHP